MRGPHVPVPRETITVIPDSAVTPLQQRVAAGNQVREAATPGRRGCGRSASGRRRRRPPARPARACAESKHGGAAGRPSSAPGGPAFGAGSGRVGAQVRFVDARENQPGGELRPSGRGAPRNTAASSVGSRPWRCGRGTRGCRYRPSTPSGAERRRAWASSRGVVAGPPALRRTSPQAARRRRAAAAATLLTQTQRVQSAPTWRRGAGPRPLRSRSPVAALPAVRPAATS